jgi:hypothetical protein
MMIRAWLLPLIVLAIAVPIAAGFLIAGPGLGVAVGAFVGAALVIVVARMRPETRIEVARAADHRHRLLVVALVAIEEPAAAAAIAQSAVGGTDVLVLAPAFNRALDHWADDLSRAREGAQQRLVLSLGTLAAAGVEARGSVGDADPVQAVEDSLRAFAADEAIVVAEPVEGKGEGARTLTELRARLDLPLRLVET